MKADLRGVGRAASDLKAALHSLGIRGNVVIEVGADRWQALVDGGFANGGDVVHVPLRPTTDAVTTTDEEAIAAYGELQIRREHSAPGNSLVPEPPFTLDMARENLKRAAKLFSEHEARLNALRDEQDTLARSEPLGKELGRYETRLVALERFAWQIDKTTSMEQGVRR